MKEALGSEDVTMVWPWVSAGSDGRVAVTVFATPTPEPSHEGDADRVWSVVTVASMAAGAEDATFSGHVVKEGHHIGPICQSGTTCQVGSAQGDDGSDRRLGDFFETTIDHEGRLHITYADTATRGQDVISHPGYVRQVGGPSFLAEGDDWVPTQG